MSIYSPGSVFSYRDSGQVSFEELNLPLGEIPEENDYLTGEKLYTGLVSSEVDEALERYHVSASRYADGSFEFRAANNSYFSREKPSIIAFKGEIEYFENGEPVEAEYHHIMVELSAPDEDAIDTLEEDLDLLEEGLRDHYSEASSESYAERRHTTIAD